MAVALSHHPRGASAPASDLLRNFSFAALLGVVVFTQLDAVGNRLTDGWPISAYALCYAATCAAALAWVAAERRPPPGPVLAGGGRWTAMLLLWAAVAWALSADREAGLDYLAGLLIAAGPAFLILRLADTPPRLVRLVAVIVVSGIVSALIVHYDMFTGDRLVSRAPAAVTAQFDGVARSAGGSDENPTTAAQMIMVSAALMAGMIATAMRRRLLVPGCAVAIAALAVMGARSAILGLLVIALIGLWRRRRSRGAALYAVGLVVVAAAALLLLPQLAGRILALFDWAQDPTLFRRVTYLRIGFDGLAGSPVWGVGPGNFPVLYADDAYRFLPGRETTPRELHNTYLDVAVELGLIGFALFAAVIASAVASIRAGMASLDPQLHCASIAVGLAIAALLTASLFMPNKDMKMLWILFGLAFQCGRLRRAEAFRR